MKTLKKDICFFQINTWNSEYKQTWEEPAQIIWFNPWLLSNIFWESVNKMNDFSYEVGILQISILQIGKLWHTHVNNPDHCPTTNLQQTED